MQRVKNRSRSRKTESSQIDANERNSVETQVIANCELSSNAKTEYRILTRKKVAQIRNTKI